MDSAALKSAWLCWFTMVDRCCSEKNPAYHNYGGRGIRVCKRWLGLDGFKHFVQDMGFKPSKSLSLDRRDNNKGYSKSNCRWATKTQQARNRRSNKLLTVDGTTLAMAEWAERVGINPRVIQDRLRKGWGVREAIFTKRREDDNIPIGTTIAKWLVVGDGGRTHNGKKLYSCKCLCGKLRNVSGFDLRSGKSISCKSCSLLGNTFAKKW
jgi:hypothetical protein